MARYIGTLVTAHKTHTGIAIRADYADYADCGISNLLIALHQERFNSVPGPPFTALLWRRISFAVSLGRWHAFAYSILKCLTSSLVARLQSQKPTRHTLLAEPRFRKLSKRSVLQGHCRKRRAAWRLKRLLGLTPANINAFITVLRLTHGIES
jgi:hypothetical protein